jgi:hypothetical protein
VGVAGQTAGSDMDVLCAGAIVVAWNIREIEFFPDTVDRDSGAVKALLVDGVAGPFHSWWRDIRYRLGGGRGCEPRNACT